MVNATWFVRSDGKIRGPFEALQLHQMLQRGVLLWHHELSENRRHWIRAQEHPIFEGLAPKDDDDLTIGPVSEPPIQPALPVQPRQGPPPLPVRAAPPPPPPIPQPKPPQAPAPHPDVDWKEVAQEVFERLIEKKKQAEALPPLPVVDETQPMYSLDLEETSQDMKLNDPPDTGAWFDGFDTDSWKDT